MRKYLKSPFVLATLGGLVAIITDIGWVIGDMIISFKIYHPAVLIGLTLAAIICVLAIKQYLHRGYMRAEETNRRNYIKTHKINKIFK